MSNQFARRVSTLSSHRYNPLGNPAAGGGSRVGKSIFSIEDVKPDKVDWYHKQYKDPKNKGFSLSSEYLLDKENNVSVKSYFVCLPPLIVTKAFGWITPTTISDNAAESSSTSTLTDEDKNRYLQLEITPDVMDWIVDMEDHLKKYCAEKSKDLFATRNANLDAMFSTMINDNKYIYTSNKFQRPFVTTTSQDVRDVIAASGKPLAPEPGDSVQCIIVLEGNYAANSLRVRLRLMGARVLEKGAKNMNIVDENDFEFIDYDP